jgi:methylphosphonate synthase
LILALTYGNKLAADTQQELSAIGEELGIQFHLDFSSREKAFSSLLKFYIDASSLSLNELSNRTNISKNIIEKYLDNISSLPTIEEIKNFADALNIQTRDLLPPDIIEEKVLVRDYNTAPRWLYPDSTEMYELIELVNSKNLPDSKALELTIRFSELDDTLDLKMGLHQYVYNVGETPISFSWKHGGKLYNEKINPDDSIYIKPFIPHNFRQKGKLLILRIGSRITGDAQREFSNFDKNDANRAIQETQMWFNPEGK